MKVTGMFRRLQLRFIGLIMAVVTAILVVMFAIMGAISYQSSLDQLASDLNAAIDISADEGGKAAGGPQGMRAGAPEALKLEEDAASAMAAAPPPLDRHPEKRMATPVAVYVSDGPSLVAAPRSGAALDEDVLADAMATVEAAPLDALTPAVQGMVLLKRDVRGATYVAFANDSALAGLETLCSIFAAVGAGALVVFLLISILFSRWALRPVQQAWTRQREFVANASHELKTPLSIIKANTEILLEEPSADADARGRWLASTKEASESMEQVLEELLELADMDESAEKGRRFDGEDERADPVDLSRIVEGAALRFESRAFEGGFSYEMDIEEGLMVRADGTAIARLVQILLDNACKYVDGKGRVSVRLSADGAGMRAMMSVSNTGEGIPPEKLDRIFDRFFRVDGAHGASGGHGLGLAIAKEISDGMDAGLAAASEEGITTFTFSLPLARSSSDGDA